MIFQFYLIAVDDNSYDRLLETAKVLLLCSVELDDFVTTEALDAEQRNNAHANLTQHITNNCKYWIAVSSRADIVIEKVHLDYFELSSCKKMRKIRLLVSSDLKKKYLSRRFWYL